MHRNRANWSTQNQLALFFGMMDFCCQIVATRGSDRPETPISCGFQEFGPYSHSLRLNTFCIINVYLIPGGHPESLWHSNSPAYTSLWLSKCYHDDNQGWIAVENEGFPHRHAWCGEVTRFYLFFQQFYVVIACHAVNWICISKEALIRAFRICQ